MLTKKLLKCYNSNLITEHETSDDEKEILRGENDQLNNDHLVKIRVEGLITTIAFHKARLYAQRLSQHIPHKYAVPQIREMLQVDWHEYLQKMRVRVGGKMWVLKRHVAVFIDDEIIGSDIEFFDYINELYVFHMPENTEYYDKLIKEYYKEFIENTGRIYVYFTFTMDGSALGTLLFMLYSDLLPHTCEHFLNLCTGKYESVKNCATSPYVNTSIHRVVQNGWIQFGDTTGSNAILISDESYCIPHNRRGVLSMANNGKHSNGSQIIVSLKPNAWMDYHYVAFGQLVDGIHVLNTIENIPTYYESPLKQIIISECGEYILLDEEPKLLGETDIFLEREPWMVIGGENMDAVHQYPFNTYSDISMWLDNVVDEIDVRDTSSLLMAERYLSGLYCLSTDYLSEISIYHIINNEEFTKKIDVTFAMNLRELLMSFQVDSMNKEEKTIFIQKLCKIILSYALNFSNTERCARCISMDAYGTVHKILECAYDIARAVIAKTLKEDLNAIDTKAEINNFLKSKHCENTSFDASLSLLEEILHKSILHSLESTDANYE